MLLTLTSNHLVQREIFLIWSRKSFAVELRNLFAVKFDIGKKNIGESGSNEIFMLIPGRAHTLFRLKGDRFQKQFRRTAMAIMTLRRFLSSSEIMFIQMSNWVLSRWKNRSVSMLH